MRLQMLNADVAGVRYDASGSKAPPTASWIGVPPNAPIPTASPMIMNENALITTICRTRSRGVADAEDDAAAVAMSRA